MSRRWLRALTTLVLAAAAAAGGCTQGLAWLVAQFTPPKRVKAVYQPPKGKKVLVFVDDQKFPVEYEPVKYELAARINKQLIEHKIARSTVRYELLQNLSTTRDFHRLAISEVGAKLGADLVLYVQIEAFSLKDNPYSPLWQGRLETSVWFVDARKPAKLWPTDVPHGSGHIVPPVEFKPTENPSVTYGEEVAKSLAAQMAERIVKLFYDHYEAADPHHDEGPKSGDDEGWGDWSLSE
ncbi:MAG TPA: hypothetical protein VNA25_24325 [Phycisphaerae bacterium]|nr:hypothetical protein [Phycisphaerae bacterium]